MDSMGFMGIAKTGLDVNRATTNLFLVLEMADDVRVTKSAPVIHERSQVMGLGSEVFFAILKAVEAASGTEVPKAKDMA